MGVGPVIRIKALRLVVVATAAVAMSGACGEPIIPTGAGRAALLAAGGRCADPASVGDFATANPSRVDLDPDAVRAAISFASNQRAMSVRVYRRDCLVGTSGLDPSTQFAPANLWSATKGVTSLLVGRAVTLGRLGLDDPIGRYLPKADAAHAAITVRQLLTQTSGLAFHWANDVAAGNADSADYTLRLGFEHDPGTYFEYAQTTVTTLGAVVEAAVGRDLQEFADAELFGPLGIPRGRWSWMRDAAGHSLGYAFLAMAPVDLARLGALLVHRGRWGDRQLIDPAYVDQMSASTATNPSYGFLMWTNRGEWGYSVSSMVRKRKDHRWVRSAPTDMYGMSGMLDQFVYVIPSLDMVIVRTGFAGPDDWSHDFFRLLMRAVTDQKIPDPGPIAPDPSVDLSNTERLIDFWALLGVRNSGA